MACWTSSGAPPADADRALSETLMSYWVNFATHEGPNDSSLPHWPIYDSKGMIQNLGKIVEPQSNMQAERFRFLARYRIDCAFPAHWRDATR